MASKLEYLQRYMGDSSATAEKKQKKRRKKDPSATAAAASGTRIVDMDHDWTTDTQTGKRRDVTDWTGGAGVAEEDDDAPVMVAGGDVDPDDLPVIENAHEFAAELNAATKATTRKGEVREDDASPPRRARDAETKTRKPVEESDDDASPPRRRSAAVDARQRGGRSENDASPPRRPVPKRSDAEDASPPRRRAGGAREDASPPRRRGRVSHSDDDASPPRRRAVHDDEDASPPRRRAQLKSDTLAPPARKDKDRESEAPRRDRSRGRRSPSPRRHRRGSSRSVSPRRDARSSRRRSPSRSRGRARRDTSTRDRRSRSRSVEDSGRGRDRDRRHGRSPSPRARRSRRRSVSPSPETRRGRDNRSRGRGRRHTRSTSKSASPARASSPPRKPSSPKRHDDKRDVGNKTAEAPRAPPATNAKPPKDEYKARAGLFTAEEFADDLKRKAAHNDLLKGASAEDMGHKAETVYRDKKGRKLDMLNELVRQQEVLDGTREREAKEQYEWGTGRVQKEEKLNQKEILEKIKSAPFARRADDAELEAKRRERVRAFDPVNSKVFQDDSLFADDTKHKKHKKSKSKKKHSKSKTSDQKPKYAGPPAPPNRFGIQPGYRWDGVVRGTGWEEKLMLRANTQSAQSDEAYRYAVADM